MEELQGTEDATLDVLFEHNVDGSTLNELLLSGSGSRVSFLAPVTFSTEMSDCEDLITSGPSTTSALLNLENQNNNDDLFKLLKQWNLEVLFERFLAENVTVDILKIIKIHHIERLLRNFDMGTQILFEHKLEKWRETIGCPLPNYFRDRSNSPFIPINDGSGPPSPSDSCVSKSHFFGTSRSSPYHSQSVTPEPLETRIVHLSTILNETKKGKMLLEHFDEKKCFQDEQRTILINTIVQYFDENDLHMTLSASYRLEQEIIERFPSEKIEFYRTSKRGRIYIKYSNQKCSARAKAKVKEICDRKSENENDKTCFVPEDDANEVMKAIKHDKLTSEEFDHCWKACSQRRLHDIQNSISTLEILSKWPEYKKPQGYRLIDIDFRTRFKGTQSIIDKWDSTSKSLLLFLNSNGVIKDKIVKAELKKLADPDLNENSRDAILLWGLHGYLIPCQRLVSKMADGSTNVKKYTITDSQESFM